MTVGGDSFIGVRLSNGRYEVLEALGEGGMALVFRARDHVLNCDVVIKVPRRSLLLDDPSFAERFKHEVQSLVALSHPHIVKVLDVGEYEGVPFAVMQYLAGGDLSRRISNDGDGAAPSMRLDEILVWLPDIAKALDFIHGQGYVHRDVKPANILFDQYGQSYLGDFGVAKAIRSSVEQTHRGPLTGTGYVLGTPEYMAPEVIKGESYNGRADQYALGVMLYELLAGRRPFEGPAPVLYAAHLTQDPPRLEGRATALAVDSSNAVHRAMAKESNKRFASCLMLVDALQQSATGMSSSGASSAVTHPAVMSPSRPRMKLNRRIAAGVIFTTMAAVATYLIFPPSWGNQEEYPRTVSRFENSLTSQLPIPTATQQRAIPASTPTAYLPTPPVTPNASDKSGPQTELPAIEQPTPKQAREPTRVEPDDDARIKAEQAEAPVPSESLTKKQPDLLTVLGRAVEFAKLAPRPKAIPLLTRTAVLQAAAGDAIAAHETLNEAMQSAESSQSDMYKALILPMIAKAQADLGDVISSRRTLDRAAALAKSVADESITSKALENIASVQAFLGDVPSALVTAELIHKEPERSYVLRRISRAQSEAGDASGAKATANEIDDKIIRVFALYDIAVIQVKQDDRKGANETLYQALSNVRYFDNTVDRSVALRTIAAGQAHAGDTNAAKGNFEQAFRAADAIPYSASIAFNPRNRESALEYLAIEQLKSGDIDSALATTEAIRDESTKANALSAIASAQFKADDAATAHETIQHASSLALSVTDEISKGSSLMTIARVWAQAGDYREALAVAESISYESYKSDALKIIAVEKAKSGDVAGALETARSLKDGNQVWPLTEIAGLRAEAGDITGAEEIIGELKLIGPEYLSEGYLAITIAGLKSRGISVKESNEP